MAIRNLSHVRSTARSARPGRGFSLIELLVVIIIIGIIVAIVLPALSGVKNSAKEADTRQFTSQIANAATTFYNDNRRSPGYFTPQEMGSVDNAGRGFTAMQNAMLDLAGGIVKTGTNGSISVGPSNIAARRVDFLAEAMGSGTKNYIVPSAKNLKLQNGAEGGVRVGAAEHAAVPEVVDADGQPILAWIEDPTAKQSVQSVADFATTDTTAGSARFYVNSNVGLLGSDGFGKQRKNQKDLSILSPENSNAGTSLAGAMGNPGAPDDPSKNLTAILPTRSRGSCGVHAAGRDGVILSRQDRKAISVVENADVAGTATMFYGSNFKSLPGPAGTVIRDTSGKAISQDVLSAFDDIIASSN